MSGYFFFYDKTAPSGPGPPHYWGFKITLRCTTLGRTPLDDWSAWHTELPDNTQHSRQTDSHASAEFEPMAKPWL